MDVFEALYTTRAMRRLKPDPIPSEVQARILDAAIRAPSGGNRQQWRFLLVDDPAIKAQLGPLYRAGRAEYLGHGPEVDAPTGAIGRSFKHQADHFEEVPLLLFAFGRGGTIGSSIYPAVWSAMLAARAEGVGSTLTTMFAYREAEVRRILKVPEGQGWKLACCVALGYPLGRWGVAKRLPVHEVAARNAWDGPLGFAVPEPLWPERDRG